VGARGCQEVDSTELQDHHTQNVPSRPECGLVERFSHGLGPLPSRECTTTCPKLGKAAATPGCRSTPAGRSLNGVDPGSVLSSAGRETQAGRS
jgi:hypothetical protein